MSAVFTINQPYMKRNSISAEKEIPTQFKDSEKKFEPFTFVQAADCQLGMIDIYLKGNHTNPKWDEDVGLTYKLINFCNKLKPTFLVVCGDLTHSEPGSELHRQQVADLKKVFDSLDLDINLMCVCGNHDIGNEPTNEAIQAYKQNFGPDYYYYIVKGVLFIVINSQFYENRENCEAYASEHDKWLDEILSKCKDFKYSIVFQHIPWFLKDPHEEKEYFNVNRDVRLHWLNKFYKAGVTKVMCGHYHQNAGGWYDGASSGASEGARDKMELVVTSAVGAVLGKDKSGFRLVKVTEQSIEHQYYDFQMAENAFKVKL